MIIVQHDFKKVTQVTRNEQTIRLQNKSIAKAINEVSQLFADELLVWVHHDIVNQLNIEELGQIFHHKKIVASFAPTNYFGKEVGYLEDSPFIKINREVTYPTWQMNSLVGGVHTEVINATDGQIQSNSNFDYYLNSLAKLAMPQGIFCYAEPNLLKQTDAIHSDVPQASTNELFKFTAQHYKKRWTILLFLNFILFERKWPILSFLRALPYQQKKLKEASFEQIEVKSSKKVIVNKEIDVIIPTIGRKEHLYNVLKDFSKQSILPRRIIIVEQNPEPNSTSELDYLNNETWPFEIIHKFIHQTGACNARNLALEEVKSEWTFLADDDIRISDNFFKESFDKLNALKINGLVVSCLLKNETNINPYTSQTTNFGSGCSIVKSFLIRSIRFSKSYEFGFGEDVDFGMQLRNKGCDIIFTPKPNILHLKAPIGGFRTKFEFKWKNEKIQPKPSPTIMLFKMKHVTKQQLQSYQLNLFLKSLSRKDLFTIKAKLQIFKHKWNISQRWAKKIQDVD